MGKGEEGKRSSVDSKGKISPSWTKLKNTLPAEGPVDRILVVAFTNGKPREALYLFPGPVR